MLIKNVCADDIIRALETVNLEFDNNVTFNRFDAANAKKTRFNVTLRVIDSRGKGARRSHSGRRMVAACWHVYGTFIDALPTHAIVNKPTVTGYNKWGREMIKRLDGKPGDEWQDWNIGSVMSPMYYSEACDC